MPTNDQDARALTYLACRIRKETKGAREWDEAGTHAVIAELVGHNLAMTVERVTRHAADPEAKTPGAIRRPFVPDAPKSETRFPAKAGDDCRTHPGEHADNCRSCAADQHVGDRSRPRSTRRLDPERVKAKADQARAALRPHATEEHA